MKRPIRYGFTLIELLVVIAIIAILASILFPVFARAREKARAASCLSNVKQMGLAVEQYKQDYDGWYPFGARVSPAPTKNWYVAFLDPYIKNSQVTLCPSQPEEWEIGYSYNQMFGYRMGDSRAGNPTYYASFCGATIPIYDGVNEAGVTQPSTSILMTEASLYYYYLVIDAGYTVAQANINLSIFFPNSNATTMRNRFAKREAEIHTGGANVLYADGHAKWQRLTNIVIPQNWCSYR